MADLPSCFSDEELSDNEDEETPGEDEVDGPADSPSWIGYFKEKARVAMMSALGDILAWHAEPNKKRPKYPATKLDGGPPPNGSVAIIGGGPAGIHMAHLLRQKDNRRLITIFERSDRIGGKSRTRFHRGAYHEMGTCYISPAYTKVKQLLRDFSNDDQVEVVGRSVFEPSSDRALPFRKWIFREVAKHIGGHPSKPHCAWEVFRQSFAYTDLHKKLLGDYDGFLMPRPSVEVMEELNCSIDEFLTRHQLNALKPVFMLAFTLQGYGYLEHTSALYGLMWVTPLLLTGLVEQLKFRKALPCRELSKRPAGERRTITMLVRGFELLWQTMAEKHDLDIIREADITAIKRDHTGVHIDYKTSGKARRMSYDFLVIAAPIQEVLPVLDARDDEHQIFSKVKVSTFVTTLFDYEPAKTPVQPAVDSWFCNLVAGKDYPVWSVRDTHHLLRQSKCPFHLEDKHVGSAVSYQFADRPLKSGDSDIIAEEHSNHFERHGLKKVKVIERQTWQYFPHYSAEEMSRGVLWDIISMQGRHRTWYTGAWTSFEAVNAIVSYNTMLVDLWTEQNAECDAIRHLVAASRSLGVPASRASTSESEVDEYL